MRLKGRIRWLRRKGRLFICDIQCYIMFIIGVVVIFCLTVLPIVYGIYFMYRHVVEKILGS